MWRACFNAIDELLDNHFALSLMLFFVTAYAIMVMAFLFIRSLGEWL